MSSNGIKAAIIERFLEHCHRKEQLALGFLELDENVVECATIPDEIVNMLTTKFSTEDLKESGIAVAGKDEAISLVPALTGGATIVVLRDGATRQPYELLTTYGCLSADALPVFEILRDGHTQRLLEQANGDLFVACDIEHVAMLRACGLPATLAVGLDDLPLELVALFSELFGVTSYRSERMSNEEIGAEHGDESECHPEDPIFHMMRNKTNDKADGAAQTANCAASSSAGALAESIPAQLVFLGWTPLELSSAAPLQLTAIFNHFRQLQRFLGIDVHEIGLWESDEEMIERLRFLADRRNSVFFKEALFDAADNVTVGIGRYGKEGSLAVAVTDNYATALARLHECSSGEGGALLPSPIQTNEAWRDVQRLLNQQVVGPLRELALETNNPIARNLLMGFAELSNVFHMQSVAMGVQLSRRIVDRRVEHGGQLPEDQFKNLMAMADRLIGMAKATEKCNPPHATITASRTINSTIIPRLPHSE